MDLTPFLKIKPASSIAPVLWLAAGGFAAAWTPGAYPVPTRGFSVDTSSRDDVVAFWHGVYLASEGYADRMQWTGNYSATSPFTGAEGTVSAAFVGDVERRINYFRAMCGLPADVRVNTGATVKVEASDPHQPAGSTLKSAAAQRSAYMIAKTYAGLGSASPALSHNPQPGETVAWRSDAWNAHANGNLSFGFFGPGAISAYMAEDVSGTSGWNTGVGHRRWLTFPQATDFATGDTPGFYTTNGSTATLIPPTNALYVAQKPTEMAPDVTPRFVPYPAAGYFPVPLNTRFWSLSYPGADFSTATVTMTDQAGVVIPVAKKPVVNGFGASTIVWDVSGTVANARSVTEDRAFDVVIQGIGGSGVPASHSYRVVLINPNVGNSRELAGTGQPHASTPAKYRFDPPSMAEAVQVNAFQSEPATWTESAEDASPNLFIDRRPDPDAYELRSTASFSGFGPISGAKSYYLTFPVQYDILEQKAPTQIVEIDRDILPSASAKLRFQYRRGYMGPGVHLITEISHDGGSSWSSAGTSITGKPLNGSNLDADLVPQSYAVDLPASDSPVRLRFRYVWISGGFLSQQLAPSHPTGIFLDDISLENCDWLELRKTNDLAAGQQDFVFTSSTAGAALASGQEWHLRMRTKLGNTWMTYGPMKSLTVSATQLTGYDAWQEYEMPGLSGGFDDDHDGDGLANGLEYAFSLDPFERTVVQDALLPDLASKTLSMARVLPSVKPGIQYQAERSDDLKTWTPDGVSVSTVGGQALATVPMAGGPRFLRWKITKQ